MFTYEVVKIKYNIWKSKYEENLEDVLNDYALDGWRLVQVLKTNENGTYHLKVIFEKPLKESADRYRDSRFSGMVWFFKKNVSWSFIGTQAFLPVFLFC